MRLASFDVIWDYFARRFGLLREDGGVVVMFAIKTLVSSTVGNLADLIVRLYRNIFLYACRVSRALLSGSSWGNTVLTHHLQPLSSLIREGAAGCPHMTNRAELVPASDWVGNGDESDKLREKPS
jgi:hypothetical protein